MKQLRKKILLKFILLELLWIALGAAANLLWPVYIWGIFGGIAILTILTFFLLVSHPLNKILREFKALLTGKRYNRIYTKKMDEIGVIAHSFNAITQSLERVSTDIKDHRRISSELNIAQKIQQDLIPQSAPEIPHLDIIAKTRPAAEIGGDSFDFITKNDRTFMYIGDVTGHGVPSGLVMMIVDTLLHTFADMVENSQQLLTQVNKYLKPRIQSTMFMTMVMLQWIHETKEMKFTGAGHETIIHYKAMDNIVDNMKAGGIALGMVPDNEKLIKEQSIHFHEGDFIVLYTDGITESRNSEGEMFGEKKLVKIIEKNAEKSPSAEALFQRISTEVTHFIGDTIQQDDMTLLVIRHGAKPTTEAQNTQWSEKEQESLVDYEQEEVKESGLKEKTS
ncbi:PP2C family protein-serine/threonine phosphatase [Candidatus Peregrinibacteria bacterium]|jgi:serine phosphatase RsbU (regulator of sigma subunit)|nr:PP2C family protein-serine/threonine phosphatase [Candidatus Peregrinibacteria bacterium]MBT7484009.1 PP2C family protein-serine/threonine phosphatase [Candidatus Peregrinibacteria bacterium]MBT7702657.1 PP2C family protein-serine/threonine phosphatase [Candidatus Peregrinibacteria bacterium]